MKKILKTKFGIYVLQECVFLSFSFISLELNENDSLDLNYSSTCPQLNQYIYLFQNASEGQPQTLSFLDQLSANVEHTTKGRYKDWLPDGFVAYTCWLRSAHA